MRCRAHAVRGRHTFDQVVAGLLGPRDGLLCLCFAPVAHPHLGVDTDRVGGAGLRPDGQAIPTGRPLGHPLGACQALGAVNSTHALHRVKIYDHRKWPVAQKSCTLDQPAFFRGAICDSRPPLRAGSEKVKQGKMNAVQVSQRTSCFGPRPARANVPHFAAPRRTGLVFQTSAPRRRTIVMGLPVVPILSIAYAAGAFK